MQLDGSPLPKYRYPSAGSLYPVQSYLHIKPNRIAGLAASFYYYVGSFNVLCPFIW